MTPDDVIAEIWNMTFLEVLRVAVMDDWILFVKGWPLIVLLMAIAFFIIYFSVSTEDKNKNRSGF